KPVPLRSKPPPPARSVPRRSDREACAGPCALVHAANLGAGVVVREHRAVALAAQRPAARAILAEADAVAAAAAGEDGGVAVGLEVEEQRRKPRVAETLPQVDGIDA